MKSEDVETFTRYEKARIVGARSLQISMGAPLLINTDAIDPLEIADEEFRKQKIPITVKRMQ
ncbi:DNA-directed RNA polymerase subunit K [Methanogenium organophilum]|uniref:DNA-directed RNA polymerase subunit Rpo6 n=1 Tax=Methanogenium organophilum TaxID=2199 RepID=A0A9X9T8B6_METOG|nr:DNA-directed RNA polymerase subunit K [Methanogenium organophilum]WAI01271.1 DNA-directed RNA polymerase subunit K [Methanogenium organophilum]